MFVVVGMVLIVVGMVFVIVDMVFVGVGNTLVGMVFVGVVIVFVVITLMSVFSGVVGVRKQIPLLITMHTSSLVSENLRQLCQPFPPMHVRGFSQMMSSF